MDLATAQAFAEAGASVVLADINIAQLQAGTEALTAAGHGATGVACDVADEASTKLRATQTAPSTYGRVDMALPPRW